MRQAITEKINKESCNIDSLDTMEIVKLINREDKTVALAVEKELQNIAHAINITVERLKLGGRLLYFGAGTSGRLGVLDASECPPTFGVSEELVNGIIAGGDGALRVAVEGAEDSKDLGFQDAKEAKVCENDVVIGITASGSATYVIGVLEYANSVKAATFGLSNAEEPLIGDYTDISIAPIVGPEVISGSTRLKAGTAQKMVLNMISTVTMIKLGKTYKNLMVDLKPTNIKLKKRAINIVMYATEQSEDTAIMMLEKCDWNPKTAIVAILTGTDVEMAKQRLEASGGFVSKALED